ncbi:hypothetical protein [Okeania sp. SIO2B3]|uniref:hypothetical protein n=1 Tax=Okeania sp. SIO2B3 TaxID=2607784 RepID=UPI0013C14443|nr:hypothetical protein [Okeania sp. SIO2B3]NET44616.1 hypothetical protein [Okeania sp. SIO2B3]
MPNQVGLIKFDKCDTNLYMEKSPGNVHPLSQFASNSTNLILAEFVSHEQF